MVSILDGAPVTRKTPWHLWVVGVVAVLWNAIGPYDYLMSMTKGAAYLAASGMTPAQIAFYEAYPMWMTAAWAIGVWTAFAASVLLLLRHRWATVLFAVSTVAYVATLIYTYALHDGAALMGQKMMGFSGFILATLLLFLGYAWAMGKRGVLR